MLDTPLTVNPAFYKKLPFDPERDFTPVSVLASFSMMLVVHPSVPVRTLAEFVAFAKNRKARPLIYGSGGANGSPGQLTMEYFRLQAGFEAVHVPYRGNLQVVTDLVGGQVQAGFVATPGVLSHVREGWLKALAVSSAQRSQAAPDVPTMEEAGYRDFTVGFLFVMLVPAATPEPIRAVLERARRRWNRLVRPAAMQPQNSNPPPSDGRTSSRPPTFRRNDAAFHVTCRPRTMPWPRAALRERELRRACAKAQECPSC